MLTSLRVNILFATAQTFLTMPVKA